MSASRRCSIKRTKVAAIGHEPLATLVAKFCHGVRSIYSFSALTWNFTGRQRVGTTIGVAAGSGSR